MKKIKVKISKPVQNEAPQMAYGGQLGFGLDLLPDSYMGGYQTPLADTYQTTIKPVDREFANVEAEKGETVVADFDQDGTLEHLKIGGKKHSQGGTPLNLPDGAFIFSDSKKLKMKGNEVTPFGKSAKSKKSYTPAELAKQYEVNKYQAIIDDPNSDQLDRKTAQMMVSNYQKKLAELSLVQEAKKGFPNGIPEIAIPLFMVGNEEAAEGGDMVMEMGGSIPKAATGMTLPYDPWKGDRHENKKNKSKYTKDELDALARNIGYTGPKDNLALQRWIMQDPERMRIVQELHDQHGMPKAGRMDDGKWGYRWDQIIDRLKPQPTRPANNLPPVRMTDMPTYKSPELPVPKLPTVNRPDGPTPGEFSPAGNVTNFDYLTPDKLAYMQGVRNRAGIKRYGPWEAPVEGYLPDPTFFDPNRELASNAEQMNTQMMYNNQFSGPQSVAARNSQVAGQAAQNAADILSRYNTMNVNTANQFAGMEADIMNRLQEAKAQRANRLYQGNVIADQQYDNARMKADNDMTRAAMNAWNNRTMLGMTNDTNPYYSIDPITGKMVLTKGRSEESIFGSAPSTGGASAQPTYKAYYDEAIKQGMDAETAKKYAYDMFKGVKGAYYDKNNDGIFDMVRASGMYNGIFGPR